MPTPGGLMWSSDDLERLLVEHTDAWNSHDLDRLMGLFADDCVFEASAGPESYGRRFEGRVQVRTAFADVFDSMPDANWGDGRHFVISDDYGVSEWRLTGTLRRWQSRRCPRLRLPHDSWRQDRSERTPSESSALRWLARQPSPTAGEACGSSGCALRRGVRPQAAIGDVSAAFVAVLVAPHGWTRHASGVGRRCAEPFDEVRGGVARR